MNTVKTTLLIALLAAAPALLAAEPNPSTPAEPLPKAPIPQEDIADQAALVQQLGQEASRGFDVEAHAHALRVQIESLLSTSTTGKTKAAPEAPALAAASSGTVSKPPAAVSATQSGLTRVTRDAAIREALQKVRSGLNELEVQLNGTRRNP